MLSGPFQSCGAHYNPVPSTQVKSSTRKLIAVYFHPEQPKSLSANRNSPVHSSPAHWSTLRGISIWSAMSRAMQSRWVKWSTTYDSAVPSIRVNCHSEKATCMSNSVQFSAVQFSVVQFSAVQSSPVTSAQWSVYKFCGRGEGFLNDSLIKVYRITWNTRINLMNKKKELKKSNKS